MESPKLTDVIGIGPATAELLAKQGVHTAKDLASATVETLRAVPGFGIARATAVLKAAAQLQSADGTAPREAPTTDVPSGKKVTAAKSKKKDRKDKKKNGKDKKKNGKDKSKKKGGKDKTKKGGKDKKKEEKSGKKKKKKDSSKKKGKK